MITNSHYYYVSPMPRDVTTNKFANTSTKELCENYSLALLPTSLSHAQMWPLSSPVVHSGDYFLSYMGRDIQKLSLPGDEGSMLLLSNRPILPNG